MKADLFEACGSGADIYSRLSCRCKVARVVKTITIYDDFCHDNDPHEEHDFGAFEAEGKVIFFKIDYFDPTLTYHSDDPADPILTHRVITIMLAEEY